MDLITLAGWPAAEKPWSLSRDARRQLLDANAGFDAESRVAELEFWVTLALETETLSGPAKRRRAELAGLVRVAEQCAAALARLPTETRHALLLTLFRAGKTGMWLSQVEQALGVMSSAAREARDDIPGRGGRAPLTLRTGVIRWTCDWVERLPPLPSRAAVQVAISRNTEKDRAHVPLEAPKANIERRCLESVKIILGALALHLPRDLPAIIRRVRPKKPT
jgi:hypothetical protein